MNVRDGIVALAFVAWAAGPAMAQTPEAPNAIAPEEEPAKVIFGKWPNEGVCTEANTRTITFEDLLRRTEALADQCVSTIAWIDGRALFLSRDDAISSGSNFNDKLSKARVGLYANEKTMGKIWGTATMRVRVVGKLWDCRDLNGPNVMMVMGYCHSTGGPIIGVAEFHPLG